MFKERFYKRFYEQENEPKRPDFGSSIAPNPINTLIQKHGESLIGEIVGTKSGTYYVVRGISYLKNEAAIRGFRATQLGDYTKSRPHIVFMPGNASVVITNSLKKSVLLTNKNEYKKILQEINDEGGNVEIPLEKKSGFDIF